LDSWNNRHTQHKEYPAFKRPVRVIHVGFVVHDAKRKTISTKTSSDSTFTGKARRKDDETDWVNMQVPDGTDWIEYIAQHSPQRRQTHAPG